jgi:23S rRNA (cytosine1962-C5)-methyltransferase
MDRRRVWPDFRAEHILHEDDDLIFVHKPSGVSSQAAHPDRPDDVVTRLELFLADRDPTKKRISLGVHQRLDRDTSGVIVFTKRGDVNAALATQIEKRVSFKKKYVAGVIGWPVGRRETTLTNELVKVEDGLVAIVPKGQRSPKNAQRAVTHVRTRSGAAKGERALLDLVLETGRTHQARVQLANARAPIAGDVLYGRPHAAGMAPRLMLHALALELDHPRTKKKLSVRDDLARAEFDAWLEHGDLGMTIYDDRKALERAIALAVERRWGLGRSEDRDPPERRTTAFRLINEEGDALPGLAVDVYGNHLVVQIYSSEEWEVPGRRDRVLDALHALGFDGVYLKLRPKQSNVLVDTRRDDLAPKLPVRGTPTAEEKIVVYEEGVPFEVRLADGLSTGIFLDQRQNRRMLRAMTANTGRVANLFSYTCAFSVVAALGGAKETVSVDASLAALERGRSGFTLAGLDPRAHMFVGEDAFSWLARQAKKEQRFELIVLDPPSYSSTKKRRFVAETDYDELITLAASITLPGGKILACCNHRGMARQKLRRMAHEGVRAANREALQIKDLPASLDFPGAGGRDPHMKSVLITLR